MLAAGYVKKLLVFSLFLCLATCFLTYYGHQEKREAQQWVNHTHGVIQEGISFLRFYKEAQTSQRGFLITEDTAYLASYRLALTSAYGCLTNLEVLTADNPGQRILIKDRIIPYLNSRVRRMNEAIRIGLQDSHLGKAFVKQSGGSKELDQTIQLYVDRLIDREKDLLDARYERLRRVSTFSEFIIYTLMLTTSITVVLAFLVISRYEVQNTSLVHSLASSNQNLEVKVKEQLSQIYQVNHTLRIRNDELDSLNKELRSSEEAVRRNLHFITRLKGELEKSEKHYRLLTENSQDIITVYSLDNHFEYVSPAVRKILGYEPEELLGRFNEDLIHPEDVLSLTEAGSGNSPLQFRLRRKDGLYVWTEAMTSPIIDEQGRVLAIQTIHRDISYRKETEIQLKEAKERAEEATRMKSDFLSSMSHEIRTPLNAILSLTNLLNQSKPRDDQREKLSLLRFSGENLLSIINDILDHSKIEAGKLEIERISFNLHEVIRNTVSLQETNAHEKGIDIFCNISADTPERVMGDPVRLGQVLINLVNNAVKFTRQGHVEVNVTAEKSAGDLFAIFFDVKDTGIGIEQEKLELIFEGFSQASSDTSRKFGGTGLGLSISKRLVEVMGGKMTVQSSLENGSVFTFYLSLERASHNSIASSQEVTGIFAEKPYKILVVDDNRVNQIIVDNFFQIWGGMSADFADNGFQALQKLRDKSFDLVLMDLEMPDMDGYTATIEIRSMEDDYFRNVPVIALTASAMKEVAERVLASGMNDYVTKPFDPDVLRRKITEAVENAKSVKQSVNQNSGSSAP